MYPAATSFGSFFLFAAFILSLLVLIGQLSNKPFIQHMYFAHAYNHPHNLAYNFGLWNYCLERNDQVVQCEKPVPAYNWATAPLVSQALPHQASSTVEKDVFLALFTLYFIGTGLNLIFWLMSLPVCCIRKRALGYSMTTLVFINFLVFLAVLILALVVTLRGIDLLNNISTDWSSHAGYSMWFTIAVVASLLFALLSYFAGSVCCGPRRNSNRVEAIPYKRESKRLSEQSDPSDTSAYHSQYIPQQQQQAQYPQQAIGYNAPMAGPSGYPSNQLPMQTQRPYETPTLSHAQPFETTHT